MIARPRELAHHPAIGEVVVQYDRVTPPVCAGTTCSPQRIEGGRARKGIAILVPDLEDRRVDHLNIVIRAHVPYSVGRSETSEGDATKVNARSYGIGVQESLGFRYGIWWPHVNGLGTLPFNFPAISLPIRELTLWNLVSRIPRLPGLYLWQIAQVSLKGLWRDWFTHGGPISHQSLRGLRFHGTCGASHVEDKCQYEENQTWRIDFSVH